jgi:chromosome segregation ATPase
LSKAVAREPNGDGATMEAAADVRGRASRRVKRLEDRLGQTRTQLNRAKGRRDELEHLLERMIQTESTRREQLKAREAEVERKLIVADAVRVELDQRVATLEGERDAAREGLERHKQQAQAELDSFRSRISELESQGQAASQELRDQLAEAGSQVSREQQARTELEAKLAEQQELGRETSRQLVTAVERREELEVAYKKLEAGAEEAKAQAVDARERATELERDNARLKAQIEEAARRSQEEREWHRQLEERLTETESQAELVLRTLDEELEVTLGQTALERERRVAAETELDQVQRSRDSLREQVNGLELALASSQAGAEPKAMLEELTLARREVDSLRAELDAARAEASAPAPRESGQLEQQVERLTSELESARVEAETIKWSHDQARAQIARLEARLRELEPPAAGDTRTRRFGLGGATRFSRAPLTDPGELPGVNDEELAQAFAAMKEAEHLAEARGDREGVRSHREMARSIVEEAANREDFGEGSKMRGRKRARMLRELAAAREEALRDRPSGASAEAREEAKAD